MLKSESVSSHKFLTEFRSITFHYLYEALNLIYSEESNYIDSLNKNWSKPIRKKLTSIFTKCKKIRLLVQDLLSADYSFGKICGLLNKLRTKLFELKSIFASLTKKHQESLLKSDSKIFTKTLNKINEGIYAIEKSIEYLFYYLILEFNTLHGNQVRIKVLLDKVIQVIKSRNLKNKVAFNNQLPFDLILTVNRAPIIIVFRDLLNFLANKAAYNQIITINANKGKKFVEITILIDSFILPSKDINKIFIEGHGLDDIDLFYSKKCIRAHRGNLTAQNVKNIGKSSGLKIIVKLPV